MIKKTKSLRIVHCAETIKGGIATYLNELIHLQTQPETNHSVYIVVPDSQRSELESFKNAHVYTYPHYQSRLLNAFMLAFVVMRLSIKFKADLVHVHSTFAGFGVRIVNTLLLRPFPIIYCPHGWAWDIKTGGGFKRVIRIIEKVLSRFTHAIVCISDHEKHTAENVGIQSNKLHVVKNGLSVVAPEPKPVDVDIPEKPRKILFVGRFDEQKGSDIFISALNQLGESVHGIMAGGVVVSDEQEIIFPENISYVGWVNKNQLEYLFSISDAIAIPSRWEGFGLIALEAMRAGLPVIATNVGGLREIVVNGETGLLIQPNSVEELKSAVLSLLTSDLSKLGTAGKSRMLTYFDIKRVFAELELLYKNILNSRC